MSARADVLVDKPASAQADAMLPRPFRVREVRRDTADTVTMWLAPVDGEPLSFAGGQFTMLHAFGVGEVPISISGDPAHPELLQHTIRDVGGVTSTLVRVEPGDVLGVRGPYGVGWGVHDGTGGDVVVVAGGIGLAPLRPALLELLAHRTDFGRVVLLYGARGPEDVLYPGELATWDAGPDLEVGVTVDQAPAGYRGRVGLVTTLLPRVSFDPSRTLALVCGPEVMMRHTAEDLAARGVRPSRIRLSLERNMRCGVGLCGHCQLRELFVCLDGPVVPLDHAAPLITVREL
jgi:NAD(P)H-flavin reductase